MHQGVKKKGRKYRKYEVGREAADTKLSETKKFKKIKTKGGGEKLKLLSSNSANVLLLDGKNVQCQIISVLENHANKDFTRRNIITKGAILKVKTPEDTELKAKVTSRPGQDGVIHAIFFEKGE